MTMAGKRPLRQDTARGLADMTEDELGELVHFGNLCTATGAVTFQATPEQRDEAWRILQARKVNR
jgi:hypothetical protein